MHYLLVLNQELQRAQSINLCVQRHLRLIGLFSVVHTSQSIAYFASSSCEVGISILVTLIPFQEGTVQCLFKEACQSFLDEKMESANRRISSYVYIPTPSLSVLKFSCSTSYYRTYLCPHAICTKEQSSIFIRKFCSRFARQITFELSSKLPR